MKLSHSLAVAIATMGVTVMSHAQTSTTPTATVADSAPVAAAHAGLQERKDHQQDRIAQGLDSGTLNAGSASQLETQEAGINQEESGMRAQDNGKLSGKDKSTLRSQLNTESKDIYADKHDGDTQPAAKGRTDDRLANQQERIASGVKSSDLNDKETAKLETQEAGIGTEDAGMRAQDNGKLSAQDRKDLNHELNEESRRISRDERRTERRR